MTTRITKTFTSDDRLEVMHAIRQALREVAPTQAVELTPLHTTDNTAHPYSTPNTVYTQSISYDLQLRGGK